MNNNTNTPSLTAENIQENIENAKGFYVKAVWKSDVKPKASLKAHKLVKITSAVCRAGVDYANLTSVKEGIASGERGEVQSLPWGEWYKFPTVITHKGAFYYRLYPTKNKEQRPNSKFFVDGKQVDKETFAEYLTPSNAKKLMQPSELTCFTVKAENITGVEDFDQFELYVDDIVEETPVVEEKEYLVVLSQEIITSIKVKASSLDEANDKVMSGEFDDSNVDDVTAKDSEIISEQ
jgi:hypothetical protein